MINLMLLIDLKSGPRPALGVLCVSCVGRGRRIETLSAFTRGLVAQYLE